MMTGFEAAVQKVTRFALSSKNSFKRCTSLSEASSYTAEPEKTLKLVMVVSSYCTLGLYATFGLTIMTTEKLCVVFVVVFVFCVLRKHHVDLESSCV